MQAGMVGTEKVEAELHCRYAKSFGDFSFHCIV